jgi:CHAT domain-containing protein
MWSLDDVLRYLPVAALHDGHDYLVAKYRNEVFTPASMASLTHHPDVKSWSGVAMGISRAYGSFPPLPAVPEELRRIIRTSGKPDHEGVLPGQTMIDDTFTEANMEMALEKSYPLVHIASHFDFEPGDDTASFLLLGGPGAEGQQLSLAEIRKNPKFDFQDTELLTLSACNTAMGGTAGDGREVDGLGMLAQQKGARAVVASLWAVNDKSTGYLMQEFYRRWTTNPGLSKAEALRQAQLTMLHGTLGSETMPIERGVRLKNRAAPPINSPYSHPNYWAAFILIGNWQ